MRSFVVATLIAVAGVAASAARPSYSYAIVVEEPGALQAALRDQLRDGFVCAAVARSVDITLAKRAAVILTRAEGPAAADLPATAGVRVIISTSDVDDLAPQLDAAASEGYGLCGLTLTTRAWGTRGGDASVITVLTRTSSAPTGVTYRAFHETGRRGEWTEVQRGAAAGFLPTRVASRPQPLVSSTSDMVYLAEKTAASRPSMLDVELGGTGSGLQKDLDKAIARGYCDALATWANPERMLILLVKPLDGACDRPHDYRVTESSAFMGLNMSSSDGTLLGFHRVKDATMALYDRRGGSIDYRGAEGVIPDEDASPFRSSREVRALVDRLNADGDSGFLPVDVAWRAGAVEQARAVDVILARGRD
jgi:hypothetical protein